MPSKVTGIVLLNKKEWNADVRKGIRSWCALRLQKISFESATAAKKNVPPTYAHWSHRTEPNYPYYRAKGRLKRNIRSDKRAKGQNRLEIRVGVGRRGHPKHSARIHEFGGTIVSGTWMKFRIGPNVKGRRQPTIYTHRVVIREKRYLAHAIHFSLRRNAKDVRFVY